MNYEIKPPMHFKQLLAEQVKRNNESKIAYEKWLSDQEERGKSVEMEIRKYRGVNRPANNVSICEEMNFHSGLRATLVTRNIIKE